MLKYCPLFSLLPVSRLAQHNNIGRANALSLINQQKVGRVFGNLKAKISNDQTKQVLFCVKNLNTVKPGIFGPDFKVQITQICIGITGFCRATVLVTVPLVRVACT